MPVEKETADDPHPSSNVSGSKDLREREEELLAGMDEETRQRVRALRRINPNKSIESLLEMIRQSSHSGADKSGQKKNWWRR